MLEMKNVSWGIPEDGTEIIRDLTLSIDKNRLIVITGPNGSGKTSLAKLIAGIVRPSSGKILLDGEDITDMDVTERSKRGIAFAFQQPVRFKGITVRDLLRIADKNAKDCDFCAALRKVGLQPEKYLSRDVDAHLSGGEIKRVEIASVLMRSSAYTIFDEPEAGIDIWSFKELISTFENLKRTSGKALIIISHQERILSIADEIVLIEGGRIKAHGEKEVLYPQLFRQASVCPGCACNDAHTDCFRDDSARKKAAL
jgi:Fe-S cluster assembly ATP-binding protein